MDCVFYFLIQYFFQDLLLLLHLHLFASIAQESMVCIHHIFFMHSPEVRDLEELPTF